MNSTLKKTIIVISVVTIVTSLGCLLYFNSNFYLTKKAEHKRWLKLNELGSMLEKHIPEGVYVYEHDVWQYENGKDKFGNHSSTLKIIGIKEYEFAFTSEKLVIFDETKDRKEEIYFAPETIKHIEKGEFIIYYFKIDKWVIKTIKTDKLINDISENISRKEKKLDDVIYLVVQDDGKAYFRNKCSFYIIEGGYDEHSTLEFNRIVSKYSDQIPRYVSNAKYEDYIYDLETYKK